MADDVTNAELARRLDSFARDVRDDLADLVRRLDQYVLQAVYNAEKTALTGQMQTLTQQVKENEDRRRADRRWVVSAIVLPVAFVVADIALKIGGVL